VVDPPAHIAKGDFGFKLKRRCLRWLGYRGATRARQRHGGDEQRNDYSKSR
jgi:hypothetical protein